MKFFKIWSLLLISATILMFFSCDKEPTCSDGEQNGIEMGIDCGGDCPACEEEATCTDGIQNGTETDVDCGGDCPACESPLNFHLTCNIDGVPWSSGSLLNGPVLTGGGQLYGYRNFDSQLSLTSNPDFMIEQTYTARAGLSIGSTSEGQFRCSYHGPGDVSHTAYNDSGTLTVVKYDSINAYVEGTFSFKVVNYDTNMDTLEITDGSFLVPID